MICPYCGQPAIWCENKEIYGQNYGKSYMIWLCKPCDAYVGCHGNTQVPLGTMANAELRQWRVKAHDAIDPLWARAYSDYTRREVYELLEKHFGRPIHIGEADIHTCQEIIMFVLRKEPK